MGRAIFITAFSWAWAHGMNGVIGTAGAAIASATPAEDGIGPDIAAVDIAAVDTMVAAGLGADIVVAAGPRTVEDTMVAAVDPAAVDMVADLHMAAVDMAVDLRMAAAITVVTANLELLKQTAYGNKKRQSEGALPLFCGIDLDAYRQDARTQAAVERKMLVISDAAVKLRPSPSML
jgi:hypothetical protein